ncbi:MAG: hypothetical protein HY879_22270 [Deltaproteobacteria bacterium]|nr:hypothetical protein [Deltaproteobacteria bacterium]
MEKIKSSTCCIQIVIASLLYNLLHILAWELPLAVRLDWLINVIGDGVIILIIIISIILISMRKKAGLILGMIPALWAIFFQWFLVYIISGYKEPNGVWWYPLFPIFQGIMIVSFAVYTYRGDGGQPDQGIGTGLKSPSIYLYAPAAFLLVQTGQKFVREMVVGFLDNGGLKGALPSALLMLIAIAAAILLIKRVKSSIALAIFTGGFLLMQPVVYHLIMGKPCLGGLWWYPFFTVVQGAFIIYFSLLLLFNERIITADMKENNG